MAEYLATAGGLCYTVDEKTAALCAKTSGIVVDFFVYPSTTQSRGAAARTGGKRMERELYWQLFLDTGAPEAYLLYKSTRQRTDDRPS